ncbi:hypothetical protein [Xanthobacter autotrophicus]|uniref:hypothetical protein n=1 Tax=Xanthobacter autotrophicus TaxID=280 RepID=UPI003727CA43
MAAVIIPTRREGIEILDDWDGAGQRLTASGTTRFHTVRVEADEAVFDSPGRGYSLAYSNTQAQLFLTTVVAGIARGALEDAIALVQRRKRSFYYAPVPKPADDPFLHQAVGQLAANAFAAEAIILAAADALTSRATPATGTTRTEVRGMGRRLGSPGAPRHHRVLEKQANSNGPRVKLTGHCYYTPAPELELLLLDQLRTLLNGGGDEGPAPLIRPS